MRSKKTLKWMALIALTLVLGLASTGTADEPDAARPAAISCGDSISCSMSSAAVRVVNTGTGAAFYGENGAHKAGIKGRGQPGVQGYSWGGTGVSAESTNGIGLKAKSAGGTAVYAEASGSNWGVDAQGMVGVHGEALSLGAGVWGEGNILSYGVWATNDDNWALHAESGVGAAGYFVGDVDINGTLSKTGGSFKIDHPLDPENQYLYHSFVESPDMMNVYNGNVVLDGNGEAWVELPDYFEALNRDFRYQLTAIGAPGPNLYIAEEIAGNRFKIAGGEAQAKVSWQVTGIRHDPWAEANRIPVEEDKADDERGFYLYPELYGQPESLRYRTIPELYQ